MSKDKPSVYHNLTDKTCYERHCYYCAVIINNYAKEYAANIYLTNLPIYPVNNMGTYNTNWHIKKVLKYAISICSYRQQHKVFINKLWKEGNILKINLSFIIIENAMQWCHSTAFSSEVCHFQSYCTKLLNDNS